MASSHQRIVREWNPNYERSGLKSYVHLMNKYKFQPTLPGPYFVEKKSTYGGRWPKLNRVIRRHRSVALVVRKRRSGSSRRSREVPAADQQNDSEYLVPVTIGTPGKTFNLDFDTGSADLWVRTR